MMDLWLTYPEVHPALRQFTAVMYTPAIHNEMRLQLIIAGADGDLDSIIRKAVGDDPVADYVAHQAVRLHA